MNTGYKRSNGFFRGAEGFSLIELLLVMFLIMLVLAIGVVVYAGAAKRTNLQAAVEILKEDIRKVYARADSAVAVTGSDGLRHRDQYKMEFHLYSEDPPSCYRVLKRTWNVGGGAYGDWTLVTPDQNAAVRVINNEWIKPSNSSDLRITGVSGAKQQSPYEITFMSKGSILQTDADGDVQITLSSQSQSASRTVIVSIFGSVN